MSQMVIMAGLAACKRPGTPLPRTGTGLAEQRTALARWNQIHRRVHDFAERIRSMTTHLSAVQNDNSYSC